ncbi:MAG: dienelactone hydrolase family protein [Clostridia bacterium]|nr:dienelactone hydrolase family protein [Clostridia bacterium]
MQYLIRYPKGYRAGEKYPVILLLHGSGSRGTDIRALAHNDYFAITQRYEDFPFVTVAPQCHENTWFDLWETLTRLTGEILDMDFCDVSRFYAVGMSMGGYAVWQLGMSLPYRFAALVPICGGGMYWNAERLRHTPIRAFHGEDDTLVLPAESIRMVEAVNASGGHAVLTLYAECGHASWRRAFSERALFDWLLTNHR